MTINRANTFGWATHEKLTSLQQNQVDLNTTYALDKRSGQTDTLSSVISIASGASVSFLSGSTFNIASGTTATISSTISLTATSNFGVFSTANFSGVVNFNNSSVANLNGDVNIGATAVHTYNAAATLVFGGTAVNGTVTSGLTFLSGSTMLFNGGSTVTLNGTNTLGGTVSITGVTTAANVTMTSTNRLKLTSRSLTRTVCANFVPATTGWSLQSDSLGTPVTTSNTNQYGAFNLSLPDGAVLNSLIVWIEGGAGHGVSVPANLPVVTLFYKQISSGGTGSVLATKTDTFVSAASYEAVHGIQLTSISHTVVRNLAKLAVYVQSESGMNALSGLKIHGMDVTYTTTSMDDGPCN